MKYFTVKLFLLLGICSSLGSPTTNVANHLILRQRRDAEIFGNTRRLVEELVENLRNSARQAITAVQNFAVGIEEQGTLLREKISQRLHNLRERVEEAIKSANGRLTNITSGIKDCIETQQSKAEIIFNETMQKTIACADDRIQSLANLVSELTNLTNNAVQSANEALAKMRACTEQNSNKILAAGACLGSVVIETEIKGAVFATQSGIVISRINLGLATLPASLEVCAGINLVEAGINTGRIIVEIGSCSASSLFSSPSNSDSN